MIMTITAMSPTMYFGIGAILAVLAVAGMWVRFTIRPGRDEYNGPSGAMFWFIVTLLLWPFVGFTLAIAAAVVAFGTAITGIVEMIGFLVRLALRSLLGR